MIAGLLLITALRSLWCVQAFTYAGVFVWLRTTFLMYQKCVALGRPWGKSLSIMGVVPLLARVSGVVWHSPRLREHFQSVARDD